jgi:hypothetical protein
MVSSRVVRISTASPLVPAVEAVERPVEFVGVVGDREEPLVEIASLDGGVTPPADVDALAVVVAVGGLDLLVGQHRLAVGTPVEFGSLALDEPRLVEP